MPLAAYCAAKYLKHSMQLEFDRRRQPNPLIPLAVYRVRRKHYVFWEIQRVARGLPKTFTYSSWDPKAGMMYHVDLSGRMTFEKLNLREESVDLLDNPLMGPLLRRKEQVIGDAVLTKRANKVAIYYLNLHRRFDLDNYLQYKPVTAMDWVRCGYYLFMKGTGLADTYRNEQYLPKPQWLYEWERRVLALNYNSPDKGAVALGVLRCAAWEGRVVLNAINC